MTTTPCFRTSAEGEHEGRLRGELAAARIECGAVAAILVAACRDPHITLSDLTNAARATLDAAGRLAGAAHLLATDDRR